ncbi:hypothetical protein KIH27_03980 [Mycobacterium sp. M1]|uniref:PepSY domain-containing protein n=1 Tax=Mycolicibacter acidiphilus TaxID=2835306 RepID=A0ABS5RIH5_9MYCO|nr:hypothetical protein [Mycolicibacter acidiphilus]MBS9532744.1 hypothetical protein [Mycolicibacter acidiphilus]
MSTDTAVKRQALAEQAAQFGWQRTQRERVDVYNRGVYQVQAIWRDDDTVNGGSHYEDTILLTFTREYDKIRGWLAK